MKAMTLCVIAVDVQMDFLPGGALAVIDGDQILAPLSQLAREADLAIASRDWHPENHFSFSEDPEYVDGSWPPHCIQNTRGARIHSSIRKYADFTVSKGANRNPPDAYSAFEGKTARPVRHLEEILGDYAIDKIVVGGLALDYCVRYTALDANALGYRTIVPLDCTRPVHGNFLETLKVLKKAGIEIVDHYPE